MSEPTPDQVIDQIEVRQGRILHEAEYDVEPLTDLKLVHLDDLSRKDRKLLRKHPFEFVEHTGNDDHDNQVLADYLCYGDLGGNHGTLLVIEGACLGTGKKLLEPHPQFRVIAFLRTS